MNWLEFIQTGGWNDYLKPSTPKSPVVLKSLVSRAKAKRVWGRGFSVVAKDEDIRKWLEDFVEYNRLNIIVNEVEVVLSELGRQVVILDKLRNGRVMVSLATTSQYSRVSKYYWDETGFVAYRYIVQSERSYIVRSTLEGNKRIDQWFNAKDEHGEDRMATYTEGVRFDIPTDWMPEKTIEFNFDYPAGVTPVVEFLNEYKLWNSPNGTGQNYPDDYAVKHLQDVLDQAWDSLDQELQNNITRVFGSFDEKTIQDLEAGRKSAKDVNKRFFYRVDGSVWGENVPPIAILMADPKFQAYMDLVQKVKNEYFIGCGLSPEIDNTAERTETSSTFTQKDDIETIKQIKEIRVQDWNRLIAKALVLGGKWDGTGEQPATMEIHDNMVIDEFQSTNIHIAKVQAGFETIPEAIADLRGIDLEAAKDKYEEIKKEQKENFELLGEIGNPADALDFQGARNDQQETAKELGGE